MFNSVRAAAILLSAYFHTPNAATNRLTKKPTTAIISAPVTLLPNAAQRRKLLVFSHDLPLGVIGHNILDGRPDGSSEVAVRPPLVVEQPLTVTAVEISRPTPATRSLLRPRLPSYSASIARAAQTPPTSRRRTANVGADRLHDQEVARLVKRAALAAAVRGDLPEGERHRLFAGHSLRAGLASSAEVDERHVQKQLGHASAEMTRKYQRRHDRFRVNLTKASGL